MGEGTMEHFLSTTFLVEGVLMMAVALLGVASNTISVYHFANLKHQRAFHRLLLTLAIMDNLYLVSSSVVGSRLGDTFLHFSMYLNGVELNSDPHK